MDIIEHAASEHLKEIVSTAKAVAESSQDYIYTAHDDAHDDMYASIYQYLFDNFTKEEK